MINISCIEYIVSREKTKLKYGIPYYTKKGLINKEGIKSEIKHWGKYGYIIGPCEITFFSKRNVNWFNNRSFGQQKYYTSIKYLKNIFKLY
jgi:hypothetical protein